MTVGATQPTTVSVRVVRADNNQPPANGTTIVVSTSLGEFQSPGSALQSAALVTSTGFASIALFPGDVIGTGYVVAQLESSTGQAALKVVDEIEPVEASFNFQNSNNNLSIQFQNTSTGNPTRFQWEFGDGATSKEENPSHLYSLPGDYVVVLTASKPGSSSKTSELVTVTDDLEASFEEAIDDLTVVFRDTSSGDPSRWSWDFGDGRTSSVQNPTHTYGREGSYVVSLTVRRSTRSSTVSKTIAVSEGDAEDEELFITDIDPTSGGSGTTVTISGTGFRQPLRVFFGGVLAEPLGISGDTRITVKAPPVNLNSEDCNDDGDLTVGVRDVETPVDVVVELQSGTTETVRGGFTYVPSDTTCRND
jgi:PKD repeat protein